MTDTAALQDLFWALRTEHIAAGGLVPPAVYDLTRAGLFEEAVEVMAAFQASDFRDRPFRGI